MPSFIHKIMLEVVRNSGEKKKIQKALSKGRVLREKPILPLRMLYNITDSTFDNYPVYQFGRVVNGQPILYFLHGGGFVMGMTKVHFEPISTLHTKANMPVVAPDFPLPPETDAVGVVDYIVEHLTSVMAAYPDSPVILCGDSAGAHLTLNLSQRLDNLQRQRVKGAFLLFGIYDMRNPGSELTFHRDEAILNQQLTEAIPAHWSGELGIDHPVVSPILGELTNLPPLHIFSADRDPFYPAGLRFIDSLKTAGADFTHHIFKGYTHDFILFPSPDGKRGLHNIAKLIKKSLHTGDLGNLEVA